MNQFQRDAIELRIEALERRVETERRARVLVSLAAHVLAGIVVGAIIIGAFELRAIYHLVEAQAWRLR